MPGEPATGLETLDRDLTIGSKGGAVRAVNEYLTNFGYFPNQKLARLHPRWRPIVPTPPAVADVYDESTEEAVRALQRNMGLPETGAVDADTRALLKQPRCGVPDGIESLDPSDKFSLLGSRQGSETVFWSLENTVTGINVHTVRSIIEQVAAAWARPTAHTFFRVPAHTQSIAIRFDTEDQNGDDFPSNVGGATTAPADGGEIVLNSNVAWSIASPTPSTAVDLHSVILHEFGHALGIGHSSMPNAVMSGGINPGVMRRALTDDDNAAGLARKIGWERFDGAPAVDIAFHSHFGGSELYVLGGEQVPGGFQIWELPNVDLTLWRLLPGGAVRIAAMNRDPWVVNDAGNIFSWNGSGWDLKPGCATDIGMGGDGSVWIIGCTAVAGGRDIKKWSGSGWHTASGGAVRISVGPGPGAGQTAQVPWVVNDAGIVFRRTTADAHIGTWETLPGLLTDIAVSANGTAWGLGSRATTGGFPVYIWNEQPSGPGSPAAPAKRAWIATGGAARAIAADSYGNPYVVNETGSYWTY